MAGTVRDKDSTDRRREWVGVMEGDVLQALVINLVGQDGDPTDVVEGDVFYDTTGNVLKYVDNVGVKTVATV